MKREDITSSGDIKEDHLKELKLKNEIQCLIEDQQRVIRVNQEREEQNQQLEDKVKELMNEIKHLTTLQSMTQSMAMSSGKQEDDCFGGGSATNDEQDMLEYNSAKRF